MSLLTSAAKFGPASKCDFHIDPSLLQDFFRVGSQCLESPLLRDVDPDAMLAPELEANGGTVSPLMFSRMITTSFFLLGLVPVRNEETEAFKKIVMECGRSPGAKELLWCQVEGDGDCKSEGKPKFCSKVSSVSSHLEVKTTAERTFFPPFTVSLCRLLLRRLVSFSFSFERRVSLCSSHFPPPI